VIPLFVCHANCSRSMIAAYLFRDIVRAPALSAGMEVGERPAARCDQAGPIFAWPRRICAGC
jgi:protein-tyrosine-phosphatase